MTSEAFVWIFLPGREQAVVCGRLSEAADGSLAFVYGRSYKARPEAIPLKPEGMPLDGPAMAGRRTGELPGPIRDASPDAWGRFAIGYREGLDRIGEIDLLLAAPGDRIGALEFSTSPDELPIAPRHEVAIETLEAAARGAQQGKQLPRPLADALLHGTTIGGARPKATLCLDGQHWIAKFSSTSDHHRIVRWEAAAMALARLAKIRVPETRLETINGRDVLLVRRFDRPAPGEPPGRKLVLSALTLLDLDETEARLAAYPDLSEVLLKHAADPAADRTELFRRMVFNVLIGNEDDHARNHSCFWDGDWLALCPAYDIVPQARVGLEGRQAMAVGALGADGREASLANALGSAGRFGLDDGQAVAIADEVLGVVRDHWEQCFASAGVPRAEIDLLRGRTILSPNATRKPQER